jgi:TetR/AcrR family transcriptional regulator, transcriptional repressor of aconitase
VRPDAQVLNPRRVRLAAAAGRKEGKVRRTRLTREESQALTRKRLLESAHEVVARVGYENASIDLIAENAGYSKGAFYSNFDSKEAIFLELLETHAAQDVPEIAVLLDGVDDPNQMITVISDWAAQRSRDPSWGVLALELLRRARLDKTFTTRHAKLFEAQWTGLGRILLRMFPKNGAPASPEVLGALVFELTYGAASAFTRRPGVGTLVRVALTALYRAQQRRHVP